MQWNLFNGFTVFTVTMRNVVVHLAVSRKQKTGVVDDRDTPVVVSYSTGRT